MKIVGRYLRRYFRICAAFTNAPIRVASRLCIDGVGYRQSRNRLLHIGENIRRRRAAVVARYNERRKCRLYLRFKVQEIGSGQEEAVLDDDGFEETQSSVEKIVFYLAVVIHPPSYTGLYARNYVSFTIPHGFP